MLQIGDQVILPIPSVDRTGTDPKNVFAEVYKTDGKKVYLGVEAGRIKQPFLSSELEVMSRKRHIKISDQEIPLIKAYRSETSYDCVFMQMEIEL